MTRRPPRLGTCQVSGKRKWRTRDGALGVAGDRGEVYIGSCCGWWHVRPVPRDEGAEGDLALDGSGRNASERGYKAPRSDSGGSE